MISKHSQGWFTGYFEGEGCISVLGIGKRRSVIRLSISSTDEDVILRVQSLVGGAVSGPKYRPDRKPIWQWQVNGKPARDLLHMMRHSLGKRRHHKALEALAVYDKWIADGGRPR